MRRIVASAFALMTALASFAQGVTVPAESRDSKFYVVVVVIVMIFIGLFIYLFAVDRKISKFERKSKKPD